MPKKVKTRKQKLLSETRRKNAAPTAREAGYTTYSLPSPSSNTESLSPSKIPAEMDEGARTRVITADYRYLTLDLKKTMLLTFSIILAELVIKFFFKI